MTEQQKKRLEKIIGYQEFTVNIYAVVNSVMLKKGEYIRKYNELPKYIKMGLWLYKALLSQGYEFIYENDFCGLQMCPTVSIEKVEEIEVF